MAELPMEYWNQLARQFVFICALLGGFSLSVLASFLGKELTNKYLINIFRAAAVAAGSFLIAIFSMTQVLMMTTEGFPFAVTAGDMLLPRTIGVFTFIMGIISMLIIVSLAGWTKSKSLGRFTTIIGIVSLIFILMMMIRVDS